MLSEDNEIIEKLYEDLNKVTNKNIEYLKVIKTYTKRIMECDDIVDAKKWASTMLDHTVLVVENFEKD